MKKTFPKTISLILCLTIILSLLTQPSHAAQATVDLEGKSYTVTILQDNYKSSQVKVSDGKTSSIATYDKATKNVYLQSTGGKLVLNTKAINVTPTKNIVSSEVVIDTGRDKNSEYYYKVTKYGNQYKWYLQIPNKSKSIIETSSNKEALHNFRSKVNEVMQKQIEVAGLLGSSMLGVVATFISAAPATLGTSSLVAAIIALGCGITGAVMAVQLIYTQKDAIYFYNRII